MKYVLDLQTTTLLALSLLLSSCGGGGGSGSVSSGGSRVARGPITGFGSILVHDRKWTISESSIDFDGSPGEESDLKLGMVVTVEGSVDQDGEAVASSVSYDDAIEGPVSSIVDDSPDLKRLTILGQTVVVERGLTVFDDSDSGFTFDEISVSDVVEVSGILDDSGAIVASHIEEKGQFDATDPQSTDVELRGSVADFDGSSSFSIGSVSIAFDATTDLKDIEGEISDGMFVEVEGVMTSATDVLATEIELEDDILPDADQAEIHGFVSDLVGISEFRVSDQDVDATDAVLLPNVPGLLLEGAEVEIEGAIVNGTLLASELKFRNEDVKIHAEIDTDTDVDPTEGTLSLLGVEIRVTGSTRVRDQRDSDPDFDLSKILQGDFLKVRGYQNGDGTVLASELERDVAEDVILQGNLDDFDRDAGTLTVIEILVHTDDDAEFEDDDGQEVTQEEFFDRLTELGAGVVIKIKDEEDTDNVQIDFADEVEIELPD